jgi:hypothetical protein
MLNGSTAVAGNARIEGLYVDVHGWEHEPRVTPQPATACRFSGRKLETRHKVL